MLLTIRRESFNEMRYPTRLVPHLTSARANPKNKYHWLYCMHFCRYIRKCKVISEMEPVTLLEGKDLEDHWIDLYRETFRDGTFIPMWAKGTLKNMMVKI